MTIENVTKVKRHPDAAHRVVDGSAVIVLPRDAKMLTLNAVGTKIWSILDSERTVESIVSDIVEEFEVEEDVARRDVKAFVEDLRGRGALVVEG